MCLQGAVSLDWYILICSHDKSAVILTPNFEFIRFFCILFEELLVLQMPIFLSLLFMLMIYFSFFCLLSISVIILHQLVSIGNTHWW